MPLTKLTNCSLANVSKLTRANGASFTSSTLAILIVIFSCLSMCTSYAWIYGILLNTVNRVNNKSSWPSDHNNKMSRQEAVLSNKSCSAVQFPLLNIFESLSSARCRFVIIVKSCILAYGVHKWKVGVMSIAASVTCRSQAFISHWFRLTNASESSTFLFLFFYFHLLMDYLRHPIQGSQNALVKANSCCLSSLVIPTCSCWSALVKPTL